MARPRRSRSSEPVERPADLDAAIPFPPMEAELVRELPEGDEWQYEPKWDGFRGLLENASGEPAPLVAERAAAASLLPRARAARRAAAAALLPRRRDRDRAGRRRSTSTRCRRGSTRPRAACASCRPRSPRPSSPSTCSSGTASSTGRRRSPSGGRRSRSSRHGFVLSPFTLDRGEALEWLDSFEAIGLDGVIAQAARRAVPRGRAHRRREGQAGEDGRLRRRRLRWKGDGERRIATLLLGLWDDDGDLDYVGSAAVATARHDEIAAVVLPLLAGRAGAALLGAEPLGRRRARGGARPARGRRRGALRQGAGHGASATGRSSCGSAPDKDAGAMHVARASSRDSFEPASSDRCDSCHGTAPQRAVICASMEELSQALDAQPWRFPTRASASDGADEDARSSSDSGVSVAVTL